MSDEMLTNVIVEESGKKDADSMPKGRECGKKVLSGGKTLCIKDFFFAVGRGRDG